MLTVADTFENANDLVLEDYDHSTGRCKHTEHLEFTNLLFFVFLYSFYRKIDCLRRFSPLVIKHGFREFLNEFLRAGEKFSRGPSAFPSFFTLPSSLFLGEPRVLNG